ncbi:MOSC domain-containing protein [Sulfurimonas sp.]|uniref:MOSC domain-containing protein n=1 Tax=Sulfurimonas sp. TaxID=2022749 RepID=UPI002AB0A2AE|nr:MOSC domain-containing protein [Sulfurimonas sp.]
MNKNSGNVLELFISKKEQSDRINKAEITVDAKGVKEDKYYANNPNRAILITSKESYDLAKDNGIDAVYSSLGENILLDVNPYHLVPGDRLQIGQTILEITQNCTLCNSLAKVDATLPKLLENDRGIFAKVIDGGVIKKGDIVKF